MTNAALLNADRALSLRLAVLMRLGTLTASALLISGAVLAWTHDFPASTVAIIAGCAVFTALPLLKLFLVSISFYLLKERVYTAITLLVIILILGSTLTGIL